MKKRISFKKMLDTTAKKPRKAKKAKVVIHKTKKEPKKGPKKVLIKESISEHRPETKATLDKKIVLFRLANEYYGIDVSTIDEIIDIEVREKIAGMPAYVKGVISLRGESVPVVSLFNQFHLNGRPLKEKETILITGKNSKTYGILIDELKGVVDIKPSSILDVPRIFPDSEFSYLKGIVRYGVEIAAIIDIVQILNSYNL